MTQNTLKQDGTLMTIEQAFQKAASHHQAGHLQDAEYLYRIILQFQPDHPDVHHNLSLLKERVKLAAEGLEQFSTVLEANPEQAEHWFNYIDALIVTGKTEIALQVLQVGQQHGLQGEMLTVLAECLEYNMQRAKQSWAQLPAEKLLYVAKIDLKNKTAEINKKHSLHKIKVPSSNEINTLVNLFSGGEYAKVIFFAKKMTRNYPSYAFGWRMLGTALQQIGRNKEALSPLRKVIELAPDNVETRKNELVNLFNEGQYTEAIRLAKQMIEYFPNYAFGWKVLGSVLKHMEQSESALLPLQTAAELEPDNDEIHNNLAITLNDLKRYNEAEVSCRRALRINPDSAKALNTLGVILQERNLLKEAEISFQHALRIKPDYADAYNNLSNTLQELGRLDEAKIYCDQAVKINPDSAEAHNTLGIILQALNLFKEAEASYRYVLRIKPNYINAYNNLSNVLQELGRLDEAIACCNQALKINPNHALSYLTLGNVYQKRAQFNKAETCFLKALEIKPNNVEVLNNLGNTLQNLGQLDEAETYYRNALEVKLNQVKSGGDFAFHNLLFILNYHPDKTAEEIFEVYQEYDVKYCLPHKEDWQYHYNDRSISRRLKIGYVSSDFRSHSVQYFIEPLLSRHNKQAVEVYAYAELTTEDLVSKRLKGYVDHWILTNGMSDSALAERIRTDRIDVLIDLAGHTEKNRLQVLARKPAPVSISWLGYGYTTGLTAIDYFLTDIATVPPGSEYLFSETPYRVATPSFGYRPAKGMGEVNALPASTKGYVTFGTLTRPIRINYRTIRVWSEILKQVENSQLIIDSKAFIGKCMQDMFADKFAAHGITRERLQIGYHSPPWDVLRSTDIGLDCFPHNSGATLFETLYMGVPYITLAGRPSVGRLGSCILHGLGHPEWIAESEEDYINKAVELAGDLNHLSAVRATLRDQMENSPLRDEEGFALKIEQAYRNMWKTWCTKERT